VDQRLARHPGVVGRSAFEIEALAEVVGCCRTAATASVGSNCRGLGRAAVECGVWTIGGRSPSLRTPGPTVGQHDLDGRHRLIG